MDLCGFRCQILLLGRKTANENEWPESDHDIWLQAVPFNEGTRQHINGPCLTKQNFHWTCFLLPRSSGLNGSTITTAQTEYFGV